EEEKKEPEKAPGQVVEVAPGNDKEAPDARFAAESSNRVERESISRDRRAGDAVTMPQRTAREVPVEEGGESGKEGQEGEALAWGEPAEEASAGSAPGRTRVEIPSQARQDGLDLPENRPGEGSLARRPGADELIGNSERLRIAAGEGGDEGDGDAQAAGGQMAGAPRPLPS